MKIQEALQKFLLQLEADGRSCHTIQQYKRHVRLFSHWACEDGLCGDVSKITLEDIARFLTSPQARTRPDGGVKKATSTNCLRTSLKGFFSYLHQAGYIAQDPTRLTRRAICGTPPPRALSKAEKDRLLDALLQGEGFEAERDHALFHLMLATGIRLGSAVSLDVEDVDLDSGTLQIREAKGNRSERVFLGKRIREHLRRYIGDRRSGPLFTGHSGERLSSRHVQRRFALWLNRAGITHQASVHSLRHTFANDLYQRTRDVFLVKEALQHRSILSTLIYARMDENRLRAALQA